MPRATKLFGKNHQCAPGSIPGVGVKLWVEFVVGSRPLSEGFSPGTPVSPSSKNQQFQILIRPGAHDAPWVNKLITLLYIFPST